VIWKLVAFCCSLWFTWWIGRLLYIAATKGYVMALSRPFADTVETPQTRDGNPQKFWANVIFGVLFLPVALAGLYFTSTDLYAALTAGTNVH
jgi:hypothetical protein